jgi:hypothetical protein
MSLTHDAAAARALPNCLHCQKSELLCTLVILVIFRRLRFKLFKL